MALTQTDLDNIDTAIAASELEVEVDGRRVKYRSMNELLKARTHVAGVLAGAGSGAGARRTGTYRFAFTTSRE
jgi:hypothetical protein